MIMNILFIYMSTDYNLKSISPHFFSKLLTNFKRRQILNYIADSFAEEFDTLTANDGREGLATALDKTPDIIISDIMMPNMDGNKMCRMLKSDIRTSHIPIILLTAKVCKPSTTPRPQTSAKRKNSCESRSTSLTKSSSIR